MNSDAPRTPAISKGTANWQPGTAAQHHAELNAYLERMAGMPIIQEIAARTMDTLALVPGQSVLEVGCGSGVFLPLLASAVAPTGRVVGLDHAPTMVAQARARVATAGLDAVVTVEAGDAYHLPFADDSFDAAHCERVLMHLDDPTAVLREMARVVRPGGRIVVAEPDWLGIRIAHPDREGFELIYRRSLPMRQQDMGLTLYQRFAEVGLIDRQVTLVTATFDDIATMRTYSLDLEAAVEPLVTEGRIERERALAILAYLDAASRDGSFFAYGAFPIAAGRVP
jgi:SAM-dependent methyltransferase